MKKFIIQLPFDYEKAVLAQARTASYKPYAFIVEFNDGSRKFMKGPFKTAEQASGYITCNEIKRILKSDYLHPIQCDIIIYGDNSVYLECEELGKANLNKVVEKSTKLENESFVVLEYDSNGFVSDPFTVLKDINNNNCGVWVEVLVNYSFRWVFGIADTARRNFMLQRSTGKIYSTDETGVEKVNHVNIWGGKKPDKETFNLIRKFVTSSYFDSVLSEVGRWREYLPNICQEIIPLSVLVEGRIDRMLKNPIAVFDV